MYRLNKVALISTISVLTLPAALALASKWQQRQGTERMRIGYAIIQTVIASSVPGTPERMMPGVLIRIYNDNYQRESFAYSNADGIAIAPLHPGKY